MRPIRAHSAPSPQCQMGNVFGEILREVLLCEWLEQRRKIGKALANVWESSRITSSLFHSNHIPSPIPLPVASTDSCSIIYHFGKWRKTAETFSKNSSPRCRSCICIHLICPQITQIYFNFDKMLHFYEITFCDTATPVHLSFRIWGMIFPVSNISRSSICRS